MRWGLEVQLALHCCGRCCQCCFCLHLVLALSVLTVLAVVSRLLLLNLLSTLLTPPTSPLTPLTDFPPRQLRLGRGEPKPARVRMVVRMSPRRRRCSWCDLRATHPQRHVFPASNHDVPLV